MTTENMNNVTSGQTEQAKGLSATQSLKNELKTLIPDLPKDWRNLMKEKNDFYRTDKGNARLDNLRGGYAAPTLAELEFFKEITGKV